MTFAECAEAFIKAHAPGWRNAKHGDQWRKTLTTYAFPVIGDLPVSAIETTHVLKVLEPIWTSKTETAKRLRGRIENVLDWAIARRFRSGENPARWRGHLDKLLARPSKVAKVQHHAALPYADVPAFIAALQQQASVAALALQFCMLTATRSGETLGAKWSEIDEAAAVWTVPGARTKSVRDHRVPLSEAAFAIIAQQRQISAGEYLFPGAKRGRPLSNMAMVVLLRRMQRDDSPCTASAAAFAIGRASAPISPGKLSKRRWRTCSRTRQRPRTRAAIYSKSAGGSWQHGRGSVRNRWSPPEQWR